MSQFGIPENTDSPVRMFLALVELMKERPLSEIAVKEIAYEAGLSRRTFYSYFSSVENAIYKYLDILVENILKEIEGLPVTEETVSTVVLSRWYSQIPIFKVLFNDEGLESEEIFNRFFSSLEESLDTMVLPSLEMFDPYLEFFFGGLFRLMRIWSLSDNPSSLEEMLAVMREISRVMNSLTLKGPPADLNNSSPE